MIKKLAPLIGQYKRPMFLTILMIACEVGLEVAIPYLMTQIVDGGIASGDLGYIGRTGLWMILMAAASLVFGAFAARFSSTAGAGFAKNIREALFNKVQDFSFSNIDRFHTASLVTRLTTDVTSTQNTFMMMNRLAIRAPLMLICAAFMAFSVEADLALIFILAVPVLGGLMALIMSIAYPRFRKMLTQYDHLNEVVQENLTSIRVVKAFVREDFENEKFKQTSDLLKTLLLKAEKIAIWVMPLMQIVIYACLISIIWFGGGKIITGDMETGALMGFIAYAMQILISLMLLSMVFMMYVMTRASIARIAEVLDEQPGIENPEVAPLFHVADGSVEFRNVVFRYKEESCEATLSNIDLSILPGETVGIVGATGSAKTTLVQLIPRLHDLQSGVLLVGGEDVRRYDLKTLRDAVAMVLQKNVLFSGTIRQNLLWGDEHATDEEIAAACRIAQAHEFIMGFPNGYETDLGQGGVNVSGGQKQRICIARALLKRPKIMILDDSTSAVDTATDSKIREGLRKELADMTTIIIAQRLASVMDADKIVVLDEGRVSGVGRHEDLLRDNKIYQDIYNLQMEGGEEAHAKG